ncbi:MAG: serine/threonine protein kinase [Deltaproteobacteria bacterium]|nr:serine/threonine protein kinase [Deltaproteobacteria bacterium]
MDDLLDLTEKMPRDFDPAEPTTEAPRQPITLPIPKLAAEIVPLSRRRAAHGTHTGIAALPPPIPDRAKRVTAAPPPIPAARRVPTVPPPTPASPPAPTVLAASPPSAIGWLPAPSPALPSFDVGIDSEDAELEIAGGAPAHPRNTAAIAGIAVGSAVVAVLLGIGIGFSGAPAVNETSAVAPAPPHAVAPASARIEPVLVEPPPVVAAVAPAIAADPPVESLQLPISSVPAGAVVTLIHDGDATVVGRTPVIATLDPTRAYDVIVALRGHPTKIHHIDPGTTHALELVVEDAPPPEAPSPAPPVRRRPAAVTTKQRAPHGARPPAKVVAAVPTAGTLMVSSKPPCEIAIDGKPTRLVTPQREISLAAGVHKVTLTNAKLQLRKTLSVTISPRQKTKLLHDFTRR